MFRFRKFDDRLMVVFAVIAILTVIAIAILFVL
jgi:hypothetical protein